MEGPQEEGKEYAEEYQALLRQAGLSSGGAPLGAPPETMAEASDITFSTEPGPASDETVELMKSIPRQPYTSRSSMAGATVAESEGDDGGGIDATSAENEAFAAPPTELPTAAAFSQQPFSTPAAPSVVDLDIDSLAYDLDQHNLGVKRAIMSRFMAVKKKLLQHEQEVLDSERRQWAAKLSSKQDELEQAREAQHKAMVMVRRTQEYLDRALAQLARRAALQRAWQMAYVIIHKWKEAAAFQRRARHNVQRAVRHYDLKYLQRSYFSAWRSWTFTTQKMSVEELIEMKVEDGRVRAEAAAQLRVDAAMTELAAMRQRLVEETAHRKELEDKMKKAFMRGVCALNLEAMTMMKGGVLPPDLVEEVENFRPPNGGGGGAGAGGGGAAGAGGDTVGGAGAGIGGPAAGGSGAAPVPRAALPAPAPRPCAPAPRSPRPPENIRAGPARDLGAALDASAPQAARPATAPAADTVAHTPKVINGPAPLIFHHSSGRAVGGETAVRGQGVPSRLVRRGSGGFGRPSSGAGKAAAAKPAPRWA